MNLRLIPLLLIVLAGCDLANQVDSDCLSLAKNSKNRDPALEKKCASQVDFLPDAEKSFVSVVDVPYVGTDGGKVVVNLVLTDSAGKPITGITAEAVTVTGKKPDGTTEEVGVADVGTLRETVTGVTLPRASFAAVIDYSGSIPDGSLSTMSQGLSGLYKLLAAPFESEVVHFSTEVVVVQEYTSDGAALSTAAADQSTERELTSLFDGLLKGVQDTAARAESRYRFVLLFTDGADNDSTAKESDVIAAAKAAKVPIFIIAVGFADLDLIRRLATETGGYFTYIPSFKSLSGAYQELNELIGGNLQIAVDADTGAYESITVEVETKDGKKSVTVKP